MNTQLMGVIEATVLAQMQTKCSFTALDISNSLKAQRYAVRHTEIAPAVRDIFESGAMISLGYRRRLIEVRTDSGTKTTQTFLYLHQNNRAQDYTQRCQSAQPLPSASEAQPLPDHSVSAFIPPTAAASIRTCRQSVRRDGAVAVARHWVIQMGWQQGDLLSLTLQADRLVLKPVYGPSPLFVRVWGGGRLRICRKKIAKLNMANGQVTIHREHDGLSLAQTS